MVECHSIRYRDAVVMPVTLDTTPAVVNVIHYAGDTLVIEVRTQPGFVAGRIWTGQLRANTLATTVDAVFTVILGATEDDPVTLMLPSSVTRGLVTPPTTGLLQVAPSMPGLPSVRAVDSAQLPSYNGVWDVQLAPVGGGDPTTTVARGAILITLDVTRL